MVNCFVNVWFGRKERLYEYFKLASLHSCVYSWNSVHKNDICTEDVFKKHTHFFTCAMEPCYTVKDYETWTRKETTCKT